MRETTAEGLVYPMFSEFQPTSPVRETTSLYDVIDDTYAISTHVPRAGDDDIRYFGAKITVKFQPTSPVRETTFYNSSVQIACRISTHVPRAGDDNRTI